MLKKIIKDIVSLKKYFLSFLLKPKKGAILMYHSVAEDDRFFSISPRKFEKQLKFLKNKNFNVISLKKLIDSLEENISPVNKTVTLTFDDGYQDNYTVVFPLLQKYNFSATIFLVIELVGQEGYLNWEQIIEIKNSGLVEFGSHTMSHPELAKITAGELKRELKDSKQIIEEKLKTNCSFFAYPRGGFNDKVSTEIKEIGFKSALTVREGFVGLKDDLFELPRLSIDQSTSFCQFLGKISGVQFIKGRI